jgi:hypothetical protein
MNGKSYNNFGFFSHIRIDRFLLDQYGATVIVVISTVLSTWQVRTYKLFSRMVVDDDDHATSRGGGGCYSAANP